MALRNANTFFGRFKWRDDPRLRAALEALMPQPIRLKVAFTTEEKRGTIQERAEVSRGAPGL